MARRRLVRLKDIGKNPVTAVTEVPADHASQGSDNESVISDSPLWRYADTDDDSLEDFIVGDSASEEELRRGSPMKKKSTGKDVETKSFIRNTERRPRVRVRRRAFSDSEESASDESAGKGKECGHELQRDADTDTNEAQSGSLILQDPQRNSILNPATSRDIMDRERGCIANDLRDLDLSQLRISDTQHDESTVLLHNEDESQDPDDVLLSPLRSPILSEFSSVDSASPQSSPFPSDRRASGPDSSDEDGDDNDSGTLPMPVVITSRPSSNDESSRNAEPSSNVEPCQHTLSSPIRDQPVLERASTAANQKKQTKWFLGDRESMAIQWLKELDETMTGGTLAAMTADTGGLTILWDKRLLKAAGVAHYKSEKKRRHTAMKSGGDSDDKALENKDVGKIWLWIRLSEKLLTDEARLYSTVAHEFAHLAVHSLKTSPLPMTHASFDPTYLEAPYAGTRPFHHAKVGQHFRARGFDAAPLRTHGREFTEWQRCIQYVFPHRNIEVGRCHNYTAEYKYAWACVGPGITPTSKGCGSTWQRHSKSLLREGVRVCGKCGGRIVQTRPVPKNASRNVAGETPEQGTATARDLSEYQRFVKANYQRCVDNLVEKSRAGGNRSKKVSGKMAMAELGREWRLAKAQNQC